MFVSHASVATFGFCMAAFSVGLHYAGISMGWLYLWMGVMISSAVVPASLTLLWKGQNWYAATLSPPVGLVLALLAWLVTCYKMFDGDLSVANLGSNYPMLAGNVTALFSPMVLIPLLTLVFGKANYDWMSMLQLKQSDETDMSSGSDEKAMSVDVVPVGPSPEESAKLNKASKIAKISTTLASLCFLILWPMPLFGTAYVFSKTFFTGWVSVSIAWLFCSSVCVGLFPLWEGREGIMRVVRGLFK